MYKFLFVALSLAAMGYANTPDEAFGQLVNAMYSGNADVVRASLSTESIALVEMMLLMIKAQPEEAAAEISEELKVPISPDEIRNWTSLELIDAVLASPMFAEELPPRDDIVFAGAEVVGDSCLVSFNVGDYPEPFNLLMVKNGEDWKVDQSVVQAEL